MTQLNVELLNRIKNLIQQEPLTINMGIWEERQKFYETEKMFRNRVSRKANNIHTYGHKGTPSCGTVACIGGWSCILNGSKFDRRKAEDFLGISVMQAEALFEPRYWPKEFYTALARERPGSVGYAEVVCKRIDHFIQTGE